MERDIPIDIIAKYPKKRWNWEFISKNMNLTMAFMEEFRKKLNWKYVTKNPNITIKMIENDLKKSKRKQKRWDWSSISRKPDITINFIKEHIDNIDFKELSHNKFGKVVKEK